MNSIVKWGLIAGGAAYLFKDQLRLLISGAPEETVPATTDTTPATTAPAVDSAALTKTRLLAWAQAQPQFMAQGQMLNGWQWAYGYKAVRNTDPGDVGTFMDASRLVTIDEFWALATAHGLSGVRARPRPTNWTARAWGY